MFIREYTQNLPPNVRRAMKNITEDECYVAERRIRGKTGSGRNASCHKNVQDWVDKKGGERISGWLLDADVRNRKLGMYHFIFHALWKTPENKCVDVTMSNYGDRKQCIFYPDHKRSFNFEEGWGYNSLMFFSNKRSYTKFGGKWLKDIKNERLKINQLYWTDGDTTFVSFEDLDDSKFRMVGGEYAERNLEVLKAKYDVDKELTSEEIALIGMEFSIRLKDIFGERERSNAKMQIDTLRF